MDEKNLSQNTEEQQSSSRSRRILRSPDALFEEKKNEQASEKEKEGEPEKSVAKEEHDPAEKHAIGKEENNASEEETLSSYAAAFDWIKSFLLSLAVVIFVFTLIFRGVTVDGDSMLPTLFDKEYLIISDLMYTPEVGDIVVVQAPHYKNGTEPIIKRVIATGGQTVEINFKTWEVKVDGTTLDEPYILNENAYMNAESLLPDENGIALIEVKENCIFIMGDNRNNSLDSRSDLIGQIDERYIMGRVLLRISPLNRFGKVD